MSQGFCHPTPLPHHCNKILRKAGSSIFRLRAPADKPRLMMHAEAESFVEQQTALRRPSTLNLGN